MHFFRNLPIKLRLALQFSLFLAMIVGVLSALIYWFSIENTSQNIKNILQLEYENIRDSIETFKYTKE